MVCLLAAKFSHNILPHFNLFDDDNKIYTRPRLLPPTKFKKTSIDRSIMSDGCIVNAKEIDRSVIGNRSRIGIDSIIHNTYVMGNDFYQSIDEMISDTNRKKQLIGIGDRCFLNNAIVDKNCRIGNDVHIKRGKHLEDVSNELYMIKEGIVVIKKGVTIPDGYTIK